MKLYPPGVLAAAMRAYLSSRFYPPIPAGWDAAAILAWQRVQRGSATTIAAPNCPPFLRVRQYGEDAYAPGDRMDPGRVYDALRLDRFAEFLP